MADKPYLNEETWKYFWHPVCTLKELRSASERGPLMQATLLGRKLVIAELPSGVVAMDDRCIHRSSSLSLGWVENGCVRCPYHGWLYDENGKCVQIPSAPEMAIPNKARVTKYDTEVRYDLVWVRLDSALERSIPDCPGWEDKDMKNLQPDPYEWATSGARRVENYTDLSHFPFIHDGSLGNREVTTFPVPEIDQVNGELRFTYYPIDKGRQLIGPEGRWTELSHTNYRIILPFLVNLDLITKDGQRMGLWHISSPIDSGTCKNFWITSRSGDKDDLTADENLIKFQKQILDEDEPIILSQDPPEIPAPPPMELSIKTDKLHMLYRRRLAQLTVAYEEGEIGNLKSVLLEQKFESDNTYPEMGNLHK